MKRSEMAAKISNFLKEAAPETYDLYSSYGRLGDALELLKMLEDEGMLPPPTMRYVDQENGNTLCSEECCWDEECDE